MADYLKEPTKENKQRLEKLGVTKAQLDAYMKGEEYVTEIGLIQNYRSSPSRIAEKVAVFRAFFRMCDRAMDKLVKLRDRFARKYDEALSFIKIKAYLAIRRQLERAYIMLDEARRRPQNKASYLTDKQYEKLRGNKFVKQGTLKKIRQCQNFFTS